MSEVLRTLREVVSAEWDHSSIRSVIRTLQSNGRLRFDVYVQGGREAGRILEALAANKRRLGWHSRLHQPYSKRMEERGGSSAKGSSIQLARASQGNDQTVGDGEPVAPVPRKLKVLSLNVNGIRVKKEEVLRMCKKRGASVLLLQETLLKDDGWRLSLPGYTVAANFVERGTTGRRGVAVAVKNGITAVGIDFESL
jgi:hypothetical protein